jgi:HK97 family phage prohead protease
MDPKRKRSNIQYRMTEIRAADDGSGFSGYASHFGSVDSYGTAIKKGAFRKTLKERSDKIPVLWQHNPDWPIGRPTELKEDTTGLKFDASISESTTFGKDAMALLRDEVPLGMSFGFETIKSRPVEESDDLDWTNASTFYTSKEGRDYVRVIEEVRLWEISLVTFPANDQATINDVRSIAEADAISSLMEHMRAGTLTADQSALVAELVAAFTERAKPEPPSTPLPDDNARRLTPRDIEIAIALGTSRGWLGA